MKYKHKNTRESDRDNGIQQNAAFLVFLLFISSQRCFSSYGGLAYFSSYDTILCSAEKDK